MPLVEVRIGVVPLEVVGIKHTVSSEESAVCASGLAVVEGFAVRIVEQQLHIMAHGFLEGEHQAVVPGVEHAGLIENEARTGIEAWCSIGRHSRGQNSRSSGRDNVVAFGCCSGPDVGVVADRQANTSR